MSRRGYWWWEQQTFDKAIDWEGVGRATFGAMEAFFKLMEAAQGQSEDGKTTHGAKATYSDGEPDRAAQLLGVPRNATADEIRSALREKMSTSRLHPDQGGNEEDAKRLIAAKNLLIERARAVRS